MDAFSDVPVEAGRDAEFDRAFELLFKLVDVRRADEIMPLGPGAVDTASVVVWLLVSQRLKRSATLQTAVKHLVESAPVAAALYQRRGNLETDISNIKVVFDTEHIRARSEALFRKELLTCMVAYNLVVQFRRQAAALAQVPPKRLSFTGVWNTYGIFLMSKLSTDPAQWRSHFHKALHYALRDKLPLRPPPKPRTRRVHQTKQIHPVQTTNKTHETRLIPTQKHKVSAIGLTPPGSPGMSHRRPREVERRTSTRLDRSRRRRHGLLEKTFGQRLLLSVPIRVICAHSRLLLSYWK